MLTYVLHSKLSNFFEIRVITTFTTKNSAYQFFQEGQSLGHAIFFFFYFFKICSVTLFQQLKLTVELSSVSLSFDFWLVVAGALLS